MIVNSKRRLERCLIWNLQGLPFKPSPLSISLQSVPAPMWLTVLYAESTVYVGGGGGAAQSGATATLATTTRYMITDHRHAPSKHNTTATQIRHCHPACLPAYLFDLAGYRTLNVPADAVFANHTVVLRRKSYPSVFFYAFSSNPLGAKATKFSFTGS